MKPLVIMGATAVPEMIDLIMAINNHTPSFTPTAILDDNASLHGSSVEDIPVTGTLSSHTEHPEAQFLFTIGNHESRFTRKTVLERLALPDDRYATLIHPASNLYRSASIGSGSIIHFGAVIANGAKLGRWVEVLWNSVVGANSTIEDGVKIASNVTINSGILAKRFSYLGAASAIAEDVTIGSGAVIGMGSVVTRDVADGAFVFGNPPRTLKKDELPEGF